MEIVLVGPLAQAHEVRAFVQEVRLSWCEFPVSGIRMEVMIEFRNLSSPLPSHRGHDGVREGVVAFGKIFDEFTLELSLEASSKTTLISRSLSCQSCPEKGLSANVAPIWPRRCYFHIGNQRLIATSPSPHADVSPWKSVSTLVQNTCRLMSRLW